MTVKKIESFAKWIIITIGLCTFCSCTTYYYVVRHAERQDTSPNSPLSATGLQRAGILRDSLITKGIDFIYASTFLRTQQTAQPLATALGKSLQIYIPDTTKKLITVLKRIKGKRVLVVGHSDTVPEIVLGLSGETVPAIAFNDFDNLYVIKIKKRPCSRKKMWHKTYGLASP
ncbi:MAG: phosphoglycerate mutase family protein [Ginsengibacter sp.]